VSRAASLALLEVSSIAAGVRAADEIVKAADVTLLEATAVSPGKFLVAFAGDVAAVEASLAAGRRAAEDHLVDELLLARVHPAVAPALAGRGSRTVAASEAIGVVETMSVAAAIVGADAAAKAASVRLLEIATGRGIGGKGYFTMAGDVAAVQAAASAAESVAGARGFHLRTEILAGPHAALAARVAAGLLGRPEWADVPGGEGTE
jgi:microcompartment protein CcmL/EutN